MDVFNLRDRLIQDYAAYASSFVNISDARIQEYAESSFREGLFWPDALIALNPSFEHSVSIEELVAQGVLHPECASIFRRGKHDGDPGLTLTLYRHQEDAIRVAKAGGSYVLTTGTGSGKSLSYIVPIVDYALRNQGEQRVKAIIVYPMNALANSQFGELEKFLVQGYPDGSPVRFAIYTGQEGDDVRHDIITDPPDILLTNYVMLELMLTRPREARLIDAAQGLQFLVLDELHTYRGRQGADVAMLVRRVKERLAADSLQLVGTSATLSSEGTYTEQQAEIAQVATKLFGTLIAPENVIGETLQRATQEPDWDNPDYVQQILTEVENATNWVPDSYPAFVTTALARWVESMFGIRWDAESQRYARSTPLPIQGKQGAAEQLAKFTGLPATTCGTALERWLLAGYQSATEDDSDQPPFAFRLHQFISPGDTIYASLEPEDRRHITVYGQRYVPDSNREKVLYPMVFCRECGQPYYSVYRVRNAETGEFSFEPRNYRDPIDEGVGEAGYLHLSTSDPWPTDPDDQIERVPEEWLEDHKGGLRLKKSRRKYLPEHMTVGADGHQQAGPANVAWLATPFMHCLQCGVSYSPRLRSDFTKLGTLSSEGRSSATTVLSLAAIKGLREDPHLEREAQKLLSFTDNRQDASLQAGHFNDFVEVGLLRGALYRAMRRAGANGLRYDELAHRVFEELNLPLEHYASSPDARYRALDETREALRSVLRYRLYIDLRRGWRITSPNLEQTGLLHIDYMSLDELCRYEADWQGMHPALTTARPEKRAEVARTLLDYMRRSLVIDVDVLNADVQETIKQRSYSRLRYPWAIDEDDRLEYAAVMFPRPSRRGDTQNNLFVSARGGYGLYLRRRTMFPEFSGQLDVAGTEVLILDLLKALQIADIVKVVSEPKDETQVPGYQVSDAAMIWKAGDGKTPYDDPIRMPTRPAGERYTNLFFVDYYTTDSDYLHGLEAREHTAQVRYEDRRNREDSFRKADLPILFCSPTMELGVDIAELNVVNMRNVPPTPANYAQRSGRAGRGGQPALVYTYCANGSPHDQYFFRRPERMVAGEVTPPRVELSNESLIKAHVHAIWLAETGVNLGQTLVDILDVEGDDPSLLLKEHIHEVIYDSRAVDRAYHRARAVLETNLADLLDTGWYDEDWISRTLHEAPRAFDAACNRWRDLYRAALHQAQEQGRIKRDASRNSEDKRRAIRLRAEAESQLKLLTEAEHQRFSDFYSYRYFATEGFLPGYSFPRLPLSAYIPARRRSAEDEFISRPRFLAISEFGPRAHIYHEGSRYQIHQIILPVDQEDSFNRQVKRCEQCGYINEVSADRCENCNAMLNGRLSGLLRMQNVVTRRRDRINSDEEERFRLGYDIQTGLSFKPSEVKHAAVMVNGQHWADLRYIQAATLWRINLGWSNRQRDAAPGFVLDTERGYWARNEQTVDDPQDPMSERTQRVLPFVNDTRNALLFEPQVSLSDEQMASLQSALKRAIEAVYQLETRELESEPLPDSKERRLLLFYEASEGGAGVLRRLQQEPDALALVAREALRICHFNPDSGDDMGYAPQAGERCEAACYDCLLSYGNQREHSILDRYIIRDLLLDLASCSTEASSSAQPYGEQVRYLKSLCDSELEKQWLEALAERSLHLPDRGQVYLEDCMTRVDFLYSDDYTIIYIDGPHHESEYQQGLDSEQVRCLENAGYTVIRFGFDQDWDSLFTQYSYVFGASS